MYKILALEKNALVLQILEEGLRLSEFNVITLKTLDKEYQLADVEQPVCTHSFAKFEGLQLLPALQNYPQTSITFFVLMTGSFLKDISHWQAYLKLGKFLFKPFDFYFLAQTLRLKLQWPQTQ